MKLIIQKEELSDICIVLQGPILYVDQIIETYSEYKKQIIISTNHYTIKDINKLKDFGFNIKLNHPANIPGKKNFNNQVINTYNGCIWAKTNNFKFTLKIRTDLFVDNIMKLLTNFDKNCVYFSAYHNYNGGYNCEHMVFGNTEFMINLWNIPESISELAPEVQLTKKFDLIRNGEIVKYIFPILFKYDIGVEWPSHNKNLKDYQSDKLFSYEKY